MFLDIRFPDDISQGSSGGPSYKTSVVESLNGKRKKNIIWTYPLHSYDVSYAVRTKAELEAVLYMFHICEGRAHEFRFKDWSDFKSCNTYQTPSASDQILGSGDGTATDFQLIKTYSMYGISKPRKITKPVAGTLKVAIDGVETSAFTFDELGMITFDSAPAPGTTVSAGYEFDVPVEFEDDELEASLDSYAVRSSSLVLREVRL